MSTLLSCAESIPDFSNAFDECAPNFVFGEIQQLIVAPLYTEEGGDTFPTDWTSEADWSSLLDASGDTDATPVAFLIPVRGSIGEPEVTEVEASLGRKAFSSARYTIDAKVDDLSDVAYAALRQMRNVRARIWFMQAEYLYGGAQGIVADVNTNLQIDEGEDSLTIMNLKATWKGAADESAPARTASPFSVNTGS